MKCPICQWPLTQEHLEKSLVWKCESCGGQLTSTALLRKLTETKPVTRMWLRAKRREGSEQRKCPSCAQPMQEVPLRFDGGELWLDVCTSCTLVWFDPHEFEQLPDRTPAEGTSLDDELTPVDKLPPEAKKAVVEFEMEMNRRATEIREMGQMTNVGWTPDTWWQWVLGFLGLPLEQGVPKPDTPPLATWILAGVITLITALSYPFLEKSVMKFGLISAQWYRYGGLTLITSFFLHAGATHLLGNVYFLLVFGDNVEEDLGVKRFLLLLLAATVAGDFLHIALMPESTIPSIGASGGISGVIVYYALRFPKARLSMMIWIYYYFRWIRIPILLYVVFWVGYQIFIATMEMKGFSGVSGTAHLGGAAVGFAFWLWRRVSEQKAPS